MKIFFPLFLIIPSIYGQELEITNTPDLIELSWKNTFPEPTGVSSILESKIYRSDDLLTWNTLHSQSDLDSSGEGLASYQFPHDATRQFFRLEQSLTYTHRDDQASQPAVYDQQFLNALSRVRTQKNKTQESNSPSLATIDWDPTTACFWEAFNTSPEDHNLTLPANDPERRITDFRLDAAELAKYQQHGFVVSPRIAKTHINRDNGYEVVSATHVDFYYKIWTDDFPIYITADSVLDAWHRTFLGMLEEVEEIHLYPQLRKLLVADRHSKHRIDGTIVHFPPTFAHLADLSALNGIWEDNDSPGADHVRQAIADLNLYLGTAARLVIERDYEPLPLDTSSPSTWYHAAIAHTNTRMPSLYGDLFRYEDMTFYQVRGHYTNSDTLSAYFRTIVWLSRAQFQIASLSAPSEQRDRELRAAILLALHIREQGLIELWSEIESIIQNLVGQSDAMTILEMLALLESLSLDDVSTLTSEADLTTVRTALLASTYGMQEINGGQQVVECNPVSFELHRALSLFGQRWSPDAWAFNKVVFPSVVSDEVALTRRIPSSLDAAYSVLANDTSLPILESRMNNTEGVPFRDGYDYSENLQAVRSVFDSQETAFWQEHTYGSWLYSLRALSPALPASAPDTFRTQAWKRRILNTQLASWTQLRHDTLLYVEQSSTPTLLCEYPTGYVEPYPQLWQRLSDMALQYSALLSNLTLSGTFSVEPGETSDENIPLSHWQPDRGFDSTLTDPYRGPFDQVIELNRETRIGNMTTHLDFFSEICQQLQDIAQTQLNGLTLSEDQLNFIRDAVELESEGYLGVRRYSGWFPNLYYNNGITLYQDHPSTEAVPLVVDVHTDTPDPNCSGDPGAILHEAVGLAQFMLVAVKHADGTSCTYAGPVSSHYEFTEPHGTRLTDSEWQSKVAIEDIPDPEEWKLDFLAPSLPNSN